MPKNDPLRPEDYIVSLNINGLEGRMLRLPPKAKKDEMLFVYGHHASLERWFGIAEYLNDYAGVTIPDLPGFGGMDPFYRIGEKPSLDNMADYLAAFIKFRYRKKQKFSLIGLSLGFMVITRMLQKYPDLADQIDILVSFAGFTNRKDFKYKQRTYLSFRYGTALFSMRLPAAVLKYLILRAPFIRLAYAVFEPIFVKNEHTKIRGSSEEERRRRIDFEVYLWQCNDPRTYMDIAHTMFTLEMAGTQVKHPVYHLAIDHDRYFDNLRVEQHMREIYTDFKIIKVNVPAHSPSIIATAKDAAPFFKPVAHLLRDIK